MPGSTVTGAEPAGTEHVRVIYQERSRTGSGGSASIHSQPSSGGSGGRSSAGSGGWYRVEPPYHDEEEEDEIDPSDSASRARQSSRRRPSETRPAVTRRHSSRRVTEPEIEEEPRRRRSSRRHHSSRSRRHDSHRVPSDESSLGTVASHDDYPYSHHGVPPPRAYPAPQSGYRHVPAPGHGGYPPSIATSAPGFPDAYGGRQLVHMPQQDAFGYPVNGNPFTPPDPQQNPFSPMSNAAGSSYFAIDPHAPPVQHQRPPAPPRPQSFVAPSSHYGSEMMSPYGHPAMGYAGYPMSHMPGYPMPGWYPPSTHSSPPPQSEVNHDKRGKELEAIQAILQKTEEARLAWHKEMIAKAEADAAAATERRLKEEEEKRKKEEIADATKKAKEAAETKAAEAAKKAKEEADKKLQEAEKAKEEAEKKQKELEAETEKLKPPDHAGKQIKFKDAMQRKFSFPYHLCKTWKGMESLIKQAFLQIDVIGDQVRAGQYDLTGPDGEIILPQVWESMVQPDWEIEMHMWPPEEPQKRKGKGRHHDGTGIDDPFAALGLGGLGDLGIVDPGRKKPAKKDGLSSKKNKSRSHDANVITMVPPGMEGIPPPPNFPPGALDPFAMAGLQYPGMEVKDKSKSKSKSKSNNATGLAAWFAGSSAPPRAKKRS